MKEIKELAVNIKTNEMTALSLYNAGIEKCLASKSCGPFIRQFNVIHFVLDGCGIVTIDGDSYDVKKGDAFIIPSNTISYYKADNLNPWNYVWIGFIGLEAHRYSLQIIRSNKEKHLIKKMDTIFYYKLVCNLIKEDVLAKNLHLKTTSIVYSLMHDIYEKLEIENIEKVNNSLVEEIKFFLDLHYTDNLKISEVAKKFSIHENYLSKLFKDHYSISPKKYLINRKIDKAMELLLLTNLTITTIANSLGYDDSLAFSKIFKQKQRNSPSYYRKQERKKETNN